jgi:hypothetical protein
LRNFCVKGTLYQGIADPVALEKRAAANEALRLQPDLPEAHLALGYIYYRPITTTNVRFKNSLW